MKERCKTGNWQREREGRLHRACVLIRAAVGRGETVRKAARRMAGRYHGHPFKCDPKRIFNLSWLTLRCHYYRWKRGGEVAAVFRYRHKPSVLTEWMLLRFLNFIVNCQQPSMKAAFGNFTAPGRRGFKVRGKAAKVSYWQLSRCFPARYFRLIQEQQKAMKRAQKQLGGLLAVMTAEIRTQFSEHRQPGRGLDFHI